MKNGVLKGLLFAGVCAACVAAYGAFQVLTSDVPLEGVLPVVASFGCLGLLLGAIFAFDSQSEVRVANKPFLRVLLAGLSGFLLSLIWSWSVEATTLVCLLSAMLGYAGMSWAKYVDL